MIEQPKNREPQMNRIFWRFWRLCSAWENWSTDWSWFTPKIATIFVLFVYLVNWVALLLIGKRHFKAMRAMAPHPRWVLGSARPYLFLASFAFSSLLLLWVLKSSSGRKLKTPYRSALLAMGLAGMLGLITELWLTF
jgi:hypothetical protein